MFYLCDYTYFRTRNLNYIYLFCIFPQTSASSSSLSKQIIMMSMLAVIENGILLVSLVYKCNYIHQSIVPTHGHDNVIISRSNGMFSLWYVCVLSVMLVFKKNFAALRYSEKQLVELVYFIYDYRATKWAMIGVVVSCYYLLFKTTFLTLDSIIW